ncbi:MAG: hypothetical protein JWN86_4386 [Planctomycetota bacterium]|nr:hypothetical protein [Planctomycetota bacterium]
MATATTEQNDVEKIRREMAQIRQRLHQDMQGMVAGAEAASDWKHYVRQYPWAALAVTLVGGFLLVPRKRRSVSKTAEKAAEAAVAKISGVIENGQAAAQATETKAKEKKSGLLGGAFGLLSPFLIRAAQGYALSYVENWIAQQQATAANAGPSEETQPGADRSPGARQQWGA